MISHTPSRVISNYRARSEKVASCSITPQCLHFLGLSSPKFTSSPRYSVPPNHQPPHSGSRPALPVGPMRAEHAASYCTREQRPAAVSTWASPAIGPQGCCWEVSGTIERAPLCWFGIYPEEIRMVKCFLITRPPIQKDKKHLMVSL